jgi:hypothetical protein
VGTMVPWKLTLYIVVILYLYIYIYIYIYYFLSFVYFYTSHNKLNKTKICIRLLSTKFGTWAWSDVGCLFQLLGGFWPPEAEAVSKRPASQAAFHRSASDRSRAATVRTKPPAVRF